ncbi:sodium-coupled monocarboxylate transporter 1-like [Bradysia coprophila]|uniref:sodium-coupled monocarboxylate transporter 1-like n=1 Tax=Bradysia coprophila TaxID=38358 RepID=UPI00187DA0D3|nr:sodium-coupled monocarboxylate transporter 1-like [Bradysia coprophila]
MHAENIDSNNFGLTDYAVFIILLLISSGIGVYYAIKDTRAKKTARQFLTAERSLHWFPVSISLMASFQSSVTILGYPAEMYLRGTQFWIVIVSSTMAALAAAEIFLPVYYDLNLSSVNQYLKIRFNSEKVRLAATFTFLFATVPYMGVVIYGPSLALSSVTPLSTAASILLIGLVCTFYTSIGGLKSVLATDILQVMMMYAGLLLVIFRGFYLVGGIDEAFRIANENGRIQFFNVGFDPYATNNLWNCVFGMGLMWSANYCCTQTEVARYCNVNSKKKSKLALYVNLIGVASMISCACLAGIAIYAFYSKCDPLERGVITKTDQLMPYFVMETLHQFPGAAGLFVCCVFSAALSTLSSGFNALAAVTWDDILSKTRLSKLSELKIKTITKLTAISYGLMSIGMAFFVGLIGSVLKAAISLAGALMGPLLGTYLLGVICPFANAVGVLTGLVIGEAFGLFVLCGSILYPKTTDQLPTTTDGCQFNVTSVYNHTLNIESPVAVEEMFLLKIFHLAFLLVPVSGFVISYIVGFVVSLATGGLDEVNQVNPLHLNPIAWHIWPKKCVPIATRSAVPSTDAAKQ